jgi:dihydrofolate reductase
MGRIVVTEYVSLDGVMEAPGPRDVEDFKYKAWLFDSPGRGSEGDRWKLEETLGSHALLLGRVTYESFAAVWPQMTDEYPEYAQKFNSMPKYVISSTLQETTWTNSTILGGDVIEEVTDLRRRIDGDIVVHGSRRLVQTLLESDLVDELRQMVYPVLLGAGKKLFGETSERKTLDLVEAKVVGDGVLILIHRPRTGAHTK